MSVSDSLMQKFGHLLTEEQKAEVKRLQETDDSLFGTKAASYIEKTVIANTDKLREETGKPVGHLFPKREPPKEQPTDVEKKNAEIARVRLRQLVEEHLDDLTDEQKAQLTEFIEKDASDFMVYANFVRWLSLNGVKPVWKDSTSPKQRLDAAIDKLKARVGDDKAAKLKEFEKYVDKKVDDLLK